MCGTARATEAKLCLEETFMKDLTSRLTFAAPSRRQFIVGAGTVLTLLFLPALYAIWFKVRKPDV